MKGFEKTLCIGLFLIFTANPKRKARDPRDYPRSDSPGNTARRLSHNSEWRLRVITSFGFAASPTASSPPEIKPRTQSVIPVEIPSRSNSEGTFDTYQKKLLGTWSLTGALLKALKHHGRSPGRYVRPGIRIPLSPGR